MTIGKNKIGSDLRPDEYTDGGKPTGKSVIGDDVRAGESDDWWLERVQHLLPPALRTKKTNKEGDGDRGGFIDWLKR